MMLKTQQVSKPPPAPASANTSLFTDSSNYDWRADLHRSKYVDVKDEYGNWHLGVIEEIMDGGVAVRIRFDGWFDKYNQVWFLISDSGT